MIRAWFVAFLFTELVEVPIYVVGLRARPLAAFGASLITHPIVWFVIFSPRWHLAYGSKVVVAEVFAWAAEALYFSRLFGLRNAWVWSAVANGASFGMGLLCRHYLGAP